MTRDPDYAYVCHECTAFFRARDDLSRHKSETGHNASGTLKIDAAIKIGDKDFLLMTLP
jgi:hypothetical protein